MLKKKSIVLSDLEKNSNKKAVMSLEEDGVGVRGTLRLYNFAGELGGISSLGFNVNQTVYKAGLTFKSHMLYEFFLDLKNIPDKFSCAVVNFQNALPKPILFGSSEGSADDVYGAIISEIGQDKSIKNAQNVLDKFDVGFEKEEQQEIEKQIDESLCDCERNCANCIYKKYFFDHQPQEKIVGESVSLKSQSQEEKRNLEEGKDKQENHEEEKKEEKEPVFIDKLMPQINKLFEDYPFEENLQNLLPSSKWVKVDYEDDGDFYVFGLLYDDDENIQYVCYGVPAVFEEEPPKELVGYPIWLPLDKENREGFGYWLTYQDAVTGEPVRAVLE